MGDRGNIKISEGKDCVYFYTHWLGSEIPHIVQKAIGYRDRWNDAPYFRRIVFSELLKSMGSECLESRTGLGISTTVGDNENTIIEIDLANQSVSFLHRRSEKRLHLWSFNEYLNLTEIELKKYFFGE